MKATAVVRTKLYVPAGRRELSPRPQLFRRLDEGLHGRLILISGPAGFGKTTLLAEWVRQRDLPAAWLSLDQGDNEPKRFLLYIVHALQTIFPGQLEDILALLESGQAVSHGAVLPALINAIDAGIRRSPERDHLLVLDDDHLIESTEVHEAVAYLLENLPAKMHLAILSRADPPLPLPRLRARAQLTELRASDLRFSAAEAADFLNRVMALNLDAAAVTALAERTEGWIAGLQMAAISMQGRDDPESFIQSFTGSNRFILDYLLEEVLERQSPEIQAFLLRTSILERFCASLCDHVLGEAWFTEHHSSHSQEILEYLEQTNLFVIPLDDVRQCYRYHRLFADLLVKRVKGLFPELVPDLHRRASEWFETRGELPEAIEHSLEAGDDPRAAALIESVAERMMMRSEFSTLRRWLIRLHDSEFALRPMLCISHAWTLFLSNQRPDLVEKRLTQLQEKKEYSLQAAPLRAYIAAFSGRMPTAIRLARQALDELPEDHHFLRSMAYIVLASGELSDGSPEAGYRALEQAAQISDKSGNILASVMVLAGQAETYRKEGHLRKVEELYRRGLSLAVDWQGRRLPIAGRPLIGLGDLLREWNRLEEAEGLLEEGIELIERWGSLAVYSGYISLARLRQAQGRIEAAEDVLRKAERLAAQTETTPIDDWVVALARASIWITRGDFESVERWVEERRLLQHLDETGLSEGERFAQSHLRKYENVVLARLRLHQGRLEEALGLLDRLGPQVEKMDRIWLLIQIHTLKALVYDRQGMQKQALSSLKSALDLAEPEGFVRIFLDEGEPLRKLLAAAQRAGIHAEYTRKLLNAYGTGKSLDHGTSIAEPPAGVVQQAYEPLSEREMEVLRILRSMLTVPEIANQLCIAESTVRSHIKSIYSKLDVHRRQEAVERGEELGLYKAGAR